MTATISPENPANLSGAELLERLTVSKRELRKLVMKAVSLRGQVENLEHALADDVSDDGKNLARLYASAGTVLPEVVEKTFEQVQAFHRSVTAFRRHHLEDDLEKMLGRLAVTMGEIERTETEIEILQS